MLVWKCERPITSLNFSFCIEGDCSRVGDRQGHLFKTRLEHFRLHHSHHFVVTCHHNFVSFNQSWYTWISESASRSQDSSTSEVRHIIFQMRYVISYFKWGTSSYFKWGTSYHISNEVRHIILQMWSNKANLILDFSSPLRESCSINFKIICNIINNSRRKKEMSV